MNECLTKQVVNLIEKPVYLTLYTLYIRMLNV